MIKLLGSIPRDITIAFSGGVDSVAVTHFLSTSHRIRLAYFHHGTPHADAAEQFVKKFASDFDLILHTGYVPEGTLRSEASWRLARYKFLRTLDGPIITCHHLDDQVETMFLNLIRGGTPKLIPYKNGRVLRPFLLNTKETLVNWCLRKKLDYINDPSNQDVAFSRNRVRANIVPEALRINPGFYKVARRLTKTQYDSTK